MASLLNSVQVPESVILALFEDPSWHELKALEFGSRVNNDKVWLEPKAAYYS